MREMVRWLPKFPCATILCLEVWWGSSIVSEFCRESLVHVCIYPSIQHSMQIWFERVLLVVDCGFVLRGIEILHLPKSACLTCHQRHLLWESKLKYLIVHVLGTVFSPTFFSAAGFWNVLGGTKAAKSCKTWGKIWDVWKFMTSPLLASRFQFRLVHWMQAMQHIDAPVSCVTEEFHEVCLIMLNYCCFFLSLTDEYNVYWHAFWNLCVFPYLLLQR